MDLPSRNKLPRWVFPLKIFTVPQSILQRQITVLVQAVRILAEQVRIKTLSGPRAAERPRRVDDQEA